MNPLISCIIPVYNGRRFIAESLDSIFAQTYRSIEVIVADDGSTDDTPRLVKEYPQPVIYIRQPNQGSPRARNCGIQAAKGDFVAFLDSDDLWRAEKLTRQMARFQDRPELDFCVTHIQNFWMPEVAAQAEQYQGHPKSRPLPGYITDTLLATRQAFETVGLFSSELNHGDSFDWFVRARRIGVLGELLPDVLVDRRIHAGNTSHLFERRSRTEFLAILKQSLDTRRLSRPDREPHDH